MRPISERVRLGKYLKATLVASDFVALNVAYLLMVLIIGRDSQFASGTVWLTANISLIPAEWLFGSVHDTRILYADRLVLSAFKSSLLVGCVFTSLLYLLDSAVPGIQCVAFPALFFILLSLWWVISRTILKRIRNLGLNFKRVIIIGGGSTGQAVYDELRSDAGYGYRMMGVFDVSPPSPVRFNDCFCGSMDDMSRFVHLNNIDIIYYCINGEESPYLQETMRVADEDGAEFVYVPPYNRFLTGNFVPSSVGNMPCLEHTLSPLHKLRNRVVKRAGDLLFSSAFLLVSPLIFIPIAIGIKLSSPGPVFFRQKRTGIFGREFVCYKFRTMRVNAQSDTAQATENDPRKTRFGDFLRRTSLDELPQFFNVFIGNMSVVGPRPHMVSHTVEYSALIDKYMVRHAVKPGITGWAQVNGFRGGTKELWQMERRVDCDVWYIRNWNIFLDAKIILFTIINGIRGDRNAY